MKGIFFTSSATAIATSALLAIASTQPNWIASQEASAQSRPGTASTSARNLINPVSGKPPEVDCQLAFSLGAKLIHCGVGDGSKELLLPSGVDPGLLKRVAGSINERIKAEIDSNQPDLGQVEQVSDQLSPIYFPF